MPLPFVNFCTLLSDLESHASHEPPFPWARCEVLFQNTISQWIHKHKISVSSTHVDVAVILSSLLPARRTDRVYGLQADRLTKVLRRSLSLGGGRWQQLEQWRIPGRGDLGDCVERIQRQAENAIPLVEVTLEEIDETLANIAQSCRFSAPSVRQVATGMEDRTRAEILHRIYYRLQSREAKWFTRMILKDYGRVQLKEGMVLSCLDYRLPAMMKTQDHFESAVASLRAQEGYGDGLTQRVNRSTGHHPKLGVKVGRTVYLKARSINHAVQMIHGRTMSLERKYDGEYCQIHIDLLKGNDCIQIFSKSGKDSTSDRAGLHQQIKDSLRIGRETCGFSENCILEGELLVYSDEEEQISSFRKIRKHVSRTGLFLGTAHDSPPHPFEHLMICYYDVMLIDDDPVLNDSHSNRRRCLEELVTPIKGRAELVSRKECDFSTPSGPKQLQELLAHAFVHCWEGLVLKPSHEPYFRAPGQPTGNYASCWIKLKKDYIPGLGDTADFAVVGAAFKASEAARLRMSKLSKLSWTHFHIGCLKNKSDVLKGAKPYFAVIDSLHSCIKLQDLTLLNRLGQFQAVPFGSDAAAQALTVKVESGVSKLSVVFRKPFVFEVLGSGFDKNPNQDFYTLRFPRIVKIHWDRDWKETVDFDELQVMAKNAQAFSSQDVSSNIEAWVERLDQVGRSKRVMQPWYDTDGDDYEQNPVVSSDAQLAPPPPMIRMDTRDMSPERRPDNSGSDRTNSTASVATEGSLPTPPPSYPSQASDNAREPSGIRMKSAAKENSRKRSVLEEVRNGTLKRTKPRSLTLSLNRESNPVPSPQPQPLQPIINYPTQPRITPAIKPASSRDPLFSLVRKMEARTDPRSVKSKVSSDTSTGRETTAESSTDGPSQSTQESPNPIRSRTPSPDYIYTVPSHFTLPNSGTSDSPESFIIPIPSLTQSTFILGPCVSRMNYCQDLLHSPTVNVVPFPSTSFPPQEPTIDNPTPDIILLIEPLRKEPAVELLQKLVLIPGGSPAVIAMWDWRLVEDLKRAFGSGGSGKIKELDVRVYFFARLQWLPEGGILVRWGDSTDTFISAEKVEAKRRDSRKG